MMISRIVSVVLLGLLVLLPFSVSALTEEYGDGTAAGLYCPHLSTTLQRGSRDSTTGGQVSELQTFLTDYYDLSDGILVGGFFGSVTQRFVIQFQREQGLPAYGIVGSLTRARIAKLCGDSNSNTRSGTGTTCITDCNGAGTTTITTQKGASASSCTFNGKSIPNGTNISAYRASSVTAGNVCVFEIRSCINGTLSGSYAYSTCIEQSAAEQNNIELASCTFNGQTVAQGASITAYQASSVAVGGQCVSQTRTCTNGTLSGSYGYASCAVQTAAASTRTCIPAGGQLSPAIRPSQTSSRTIKVEFTMPSGWALTSMSFGDGHDAYQDMGTYQWFTQSAVYSYPIGAQTGYGSNGCVEHTYGAPGTYQIQFMTGGGSLVQGGPTVTVTN